jgi:hypothetical protein
LVSVVLCCELLMVFLVDGFESEEQNEGGQGFVWPSEEEDDPALPGYLAGSNQLPFFLHCEDLLLALAQFL